MIFCALGLPVRVEMSVEVEHAAAMHEKTSHYGRRIALWWVGGALVVALVGVFVLFGVFLLPSATVPPNAAGSLGLSEISDKGQRLSKAEENQPEAEERQRLLEAWAKEQAQARREREQLAQLEAQASPEQAIEARRKEEALVKREAEAQPLREQAARMQAKSYAGDWVTRSIRRRGGPAFR
jgi:hypothetical protein